MQKIKISASILSADLCDLKQTLLDLQESHTDMLHFDVMDGQFVNNISFGIPVLAAVKKHTNLFLDVHLMIVDPLRYVDAFADAGADLITFHLESQSDPYKTIEAIHARGLQAGVVIKPGTPAEAVLPFLPLVEVVLVMTVEPGFGGQSFMADMMEKVVFLREEIQKQQLAVTIEVDGGINAETAPIAANAGAALQVVGSYLFRQKNMEQTVAALHCLDVE